MTGGREHEFKVAPDGKLMPSEQDQDELEPQGKKRAPKKTKPQLRVQP
jgi:hypothetical protein